MTEITWLWLAVTLRKIYSINIYRNTCMFQVPTCSNSKNVFWCVSFHLYQVRWLRWCLRIFIGFWLSNLSAKKIISLILLAAWAAIWGSALVRFVALLVSFSVTSFTTLLIKKNLQMWIDWDIARHGPYQHVLGCPFCGCWHDAGARPKYSPGSEARCLGRAELLSSVVSENPINHNILRRSHQKKIQEKTDIHHTYIILVFQIFSEVSAISWFRFFVLLEI